MSSLWLDMVLMVPGGCCAFPSSQNNCSTGGNNAYLKELRSVIDQNSLADPLVN